ncbi:uncharacterized protein BJX67DRAFT_390216 [Aspergillus lucknowensis]|uniref:Beta-ketoacyl-[acyl-carrier-protein] synthase I n=1 Tax=Aspergillus lucknowensis TaxID=176173 RepID=A0ABR4LKZ7_9EURO
MAAAQDDGAQRKLAYTLLLELMSYQFASPVRWIEAQDVVLGQYRAERIIEIGPAATLTNMIKQTAQSKFLHSDRATLLQRQFLASEKQGKDIYYEDHGVGIGIDAEAPAPGAKTQAQASTGSPTAPVAPSPAPAKAEPTGGMEAIEDQPARAFEIVRTLLSRILKIPLTDVVGTQSIKSLAGGRSTLENEIIGDLASEFGSLPDRAEDLTVSDLSAALQKTFTGQMRKVLLKALHAMFASKMPGQFTVATARTYLQSRWGLGAGRQDSVLLLAIAQQPGSRLKEEPEARSFFDGLVQFYADEHGLTLGADSGAADEASGPGGSLVMDQKTLAALTGGQQALSKALLKIYAKHLDIDLDGDRRAVHDLQATVEKDLRLALDQIHQELGEDFIDGVQPVFSARKARRFDSAWSWALQDLLQLYYEVSRTGGETEVDPAANRCKHIEDAADPKLLDVLQRIVGRFEQQPVLSSLFTQLAQRCRDSLLHGRRYLAQPDQRGPRTTISAEGEISYTEQGRAEPVPLADLVYLPKSTEAKAAPLEPFLHLKQRAAGSSAWTYSRDLTEKYRAVLEQATTVGESFAGRSVLITGAGVGSIGAEVLKGLLAGGARVIVTTSRFSSSVVRMYQDLYTQAGSRGSELVVVPFNQASVQDVTALVNYIYDAQGGLHWDLDHILPFAAMPENGRTIDKIDPHSELAHRAMMVNTLRLLGAVKARKEAQGAHTRPTQVILPLSPNHGVFGGDGLYSESKLGLEALFNRWHSEDWSDYLSVCGAVIGWTRGTGLMSGNNVVAEGIEELGCRTFSQQEMAQCLLCLMFNPMCSLCEEAPLYADLSGRMGAVPDLRQKVQELRKEINETADTRRALLEELEMEARCTADSEPAKAAATPTPTAHVRLDFPPTIDYNQDIKPLAADLQGMVDLDRVVVVTGFGEIGPWGNARTRWEMEAYGEFSLEGCVEMAWLMGLVQYENGPSPGWVDAKTHERVHDHEVKQKYEEHILSHTGIRLIEPDQFGANYHPEHKQLLHEVLIQEDFPELEVPEATAQQMKLEHGDKVDIIPDPEGRDQDQCRVVLKKGAKLMVPKALRLDRTVIGQIPTGWDARKYGIPDDVISQVDPVTLYMLACSIEALLASGITDPYEIYRYIHVSEAGNCVGSSLGGLNSLQQMYRGQYTEKEVQKDILQETFVNTIGAWMNMLLMSSAGPIRTPVGACATAIESVELGYDTLISGKAKFCFVGGGDGFGEELLYEFANMKATANTVDEFEQGREASEMSRPATSTRNGFMESHGCGVQILTTARLAVEMGLPVRGVIAFAETSSDKASRSVPAPGRGILSKAREARSSAPSSSRVSSPLLKISNRRKRLDFRKKQIEFARKTALEELELEIAHIEESEAEDYIRERTAQIDAEARKDLTNAQYSLGNAFWHNDPSIAPLRGALAVWGLTIDDLDVASFHGTSTKLNEKNECSLIQAQLSHLGRAKGNVILGVFQKYLTGHPKGAAGAWMLNGALQILDTGIVPGNRNLDNVEAELQKNEQIAFLNRSLETGRGSMRAVSVTSFGFGQKGAQTIVVHPKYLFATLEEHEYKEYLDKRAKRQKKADSFFYRGLASNRLFELKSAPPWAPQKELETLLDPTRPRRNGDDRVARAVVQQESVVRRSYIQHKFITP